MDNRRKDLSEMLPKSDTYYRARYISEKLGLEINMVEEILKADTEYIVEMILNCDNVKISGLGQFKIKTVKAKPERMGVINPATGEKGMLPAREAYSRPFFQISSPIKKSVKEKTYGNLFKK